MAASEGPSIERLTDADLADCLALSAEAGWNQVAADWRLFFEHGAVWGVRQGGVVATAALLPYPAATAWISMVLTAGRARRRGFATQLMHTAMEAAAARGLAAQLDATPDGEKVYEKLGFRPLFRLTRWRRAGSRTGGNGSADEASASRDGFDLAAAVACDAAAFGVRRPAVVTGLAARGPAVLADGAVALCRDGRTAWQVGPIAATEPDSGLSALDSLLARLPPEAGAIVDTTDAGGLAEGLAARGFTADRPFLRMALDAPPAADPRRYLAAAGPELG